MARRTIESHGGFLQPLLRTGLHVLDCGCGPGSITQGIARLVAPAEVVGADSELSQVEAARESARAAGILNLRFEHASVYQLPFDDDRFDIVFAHALLEHLSNPGAALTEMHRVLKTGGFAAIRSPDWGGFLIEPRSETLGAAIEFYKGLQIQGGGDVYIGRKLKRLLREAGFEHVRFSASYESYSSLTFIGEYLAQRIDRAAEEPPYEVEQRRLRALAVAVREWQHIDDGLFAQAWCESVGYKA